MNEANNTTTTTTTTTRTRTQRRWLRGLDYKTIVALIALVLVVVFVYDHVQQQRLIAQRGRIVVAQQKSLDAAAVTASRNTDLLEQQAQTSADRFATATSQRDQLQESIDALQQFLKSQGFTFPTPTASSSAGPVATPTSGADPKPSSASPTKKPTPRPTRSPSPPSTVTQAPVAPAPSPSAMPPAPAASPLLCLLGICLP